MKTLSKLAGVTVGLAAFLGLGGLGSKTAQAQIKISSVYTVKDIKIASTLATTVLKPPTRKCTNGDETACTFSSLSDSSKKQVLVLSAGYTDANRFWTDFDEVVKQMGGSVSGDSWSVKKKNQLRYVGYFTGGGATGAPDATFGAAVAPHPVRGFALTTDNKAIINMVESTLKPSIAGLRPVAVFILIDSDQAGVTANAAPITFLKAQYPNVSYGIARGTHFDLSDRPGYIVTHELAHGAMNLLDEYIEATTKDLDVAQLDAFTGLIQLNGTWGGFILAIQNLLSVYTFKFSDILANNGSGNMANSRFPSLVGTNGFNRLEYAREGGMFFGKGTWREDGPNLMAGHSDGQFAYGHTASQMRAIDSIFGAGAQRPNDHLRTAGPNSWPFNFGSSTKVMWFDGHKNSIAQPTINYKVRVGWYERNWKTCWALFIPYPCYDDVWSEAVKTVTPQRRTVDLRLTTVYNLAGALQTLLCEMGLNATLKEAAGGIDVCAQPLATIAANFLPTFVFPLPYEWTEAPTSQWMTTYWWRVQTTNPKYTSGWTGWSSFFRSL